MWHFDTLDQETSFLAAPSLVSDTDFKGQRFSLSTRKSQLETKLLCEALGNYQWYPLRCLRLTKSVQVSSGPNEDPSVDTKIEDMWWWQWRPLIYQEISGTLRNTSNFPIYVPSTLCWRCLGIQADPSQQRADGACGTRRPPDVGIQNLAEVHALDWTIIRSLYIVKPHINLPESILG